jgi:hypothetical protein
LKAINYKKHCYKIVCESFKEENKDSPVHQLDQQIWALSQLDTIHEHPKEGKSRMPSASTDGTHAANFGYKMKESDAYAVWITNPFARACGDIVLDSFHFMVDFGNSLVISVFLQRLKMGLSDSKQVQDEMLLNPHEYDGFLIEFELFLLESVFHKPYVEQDRNASITIPAKLTKIAGNMVTILHHATLALEKFILFSKNMLKLRPSSEESVDHFSLGLVFGIGFNGALFDSPNPSASKEDEIWITFSDSGINDGGYLLLSFMKHVASVSSPRITSSLPRDFNATFTKYKSLIKQHVEKIIQRYTVVNNIEKLNEFAEFMS